MKLEKKIIDIQYEFSIPHFFEEMIDDQLTFQDIKMAILKGRIRRKFTRDPRGARYEVIGPQEMEERLLLSVE